MLSVSILKRGDVSSPLWFSESRGVRGRVFPRLRAWISRRGLGAQILDLRTERSAPLALLGRKRGGDLLRRDHRPRAGVERRGHFLRRERAIVEPRLLDLAREKS